MHKTNGHSKTILLKNKYLMKLAAENYKKNFFFILKLDKKLIFLLIFKRHLHIAIWHSKISSPLSVGDLWPIGNKHRKKIKTADSLWKANDTWYEASTIVDRDQSLACCRGLYIVFLHNYNENTFRLDRHRSKFDYKMVLEFHFDKVFIACSMIYGKIP